MVLCNIALQRLPILGVSANKNDVQQLPYLEDENIFQKFAVVLLNLVLSKIAILGSTAVADFDLQHISSQKEKKDFKPDRWVDVGKLFVYSPSIQPGFIHYFSIHTDPFQMPIT